VIYGVWHAFKTQNKPEYLERLKNLKRVGAGDVTHEARVHELQKVVTELLSALEKAGIKTEL
jgi:hypothetical protein